MSKTQKSVRSAKLLKYVETALLSLGKARKHAKKLAKHEKRAIAAFLEVEALVEDAKSCDCKKSKKKKSSKKNNAGKSKNSTSANSYVNGDKSDDALMVTAADIDEPLLSIKSLENTLDTPRDGQADELHLISGIGPKLEELLHGLGIYHFDQIANWTQAEIDWVDDYLQFSGRIERDNWIEQAKALAAGGRDEYVRVFGKEPR
jgi:predicted flap endonuclease-1-like 5' DNA nuclease